MNIDLKILSNAKYLLLSDPNGFGSVAVNTDGDKTGVIAKSGTASLRVVYDNKTLALYVFEVSEGDLIP